jgi:hypothetical protein
VLLLGGNNQKKKNQRKNGTARPQGAVVSVFPTLEVFFLQLVISDLLWILSTEKRKPPTERGSTGGLTFPRSS